MRIKLEIPRMKRKPKTAQSNAAPLTCTLVGLTGQLHETGGADAHNATHNAAHNATHNATQAHSRTPTTWNSGNRVTAIDFSFCWSVLFSPRASAETVSAKGSSTVIVHFLLALGGSAPDRKCDRQGNRDTRGRRCGRMWTKTDKRGD